MVLFAGVQTLASPVLSQERRGLKLGVDTGKAPLSVATSNLLGPRVAGTNRPPEGNRSYEFGRIRIFSVRKLIVVPQNRIDFGLRGIPWC